ncbi:MAG: Uma2 family endonuclease [Verrucomicrobia bacterium]|nr:Uma2 family endonuclease [Verrucomicrobiota bacterium]
MQSATITAERLTADDYRAMPEGGPRYQLIDGELHMAPAPSSFHQEIVWNLSQILGSYLRQSPVGRVYLAPCDVYLSEHDVVQPDLLFFTKARQHIRKDDGIHGAPDLVIEILSPSTALLDTKTKRAIYARTGVTELWIIDPSLQQIHLYDFARNHAKAVRLVEDDETFESALLPGLIISAAEVFKR